MKREVGGVGEMLWSVFILTSDLAREFWQHVTAPLMVIPSPRPGDPDEALGCVPGRHDEEEEEGREGEGRRGKALFSGPSPGAIIQPDYLSHSSGRVISCGLVTSSSAWSLPGKNVYPFIFHLYINLSILFIVVLRGRDSFDNVLFWLREFMLVIIIFFFFFLLLPFLVL